MKSILAIICLVISISSFSASITLISSNEKTVVLLVSSGSMKDCINKVKEIYKKKIVIGNNDPESACKVSERASAAEAYLEVLD